jgi:hypothetical protein
VSREASAVSVKEEIREKSFHGVHRLRAEGEHAVRNTDSKGLGGITAGTGTGTVIGTGTGAGTGTGVVVGVGMVVEEGATTGTGAGAGVGVGAGAGGGAGAGMGMVFELDAVLSPVVKTLYSAFGHTHHITGKRWQRRGEKRRGEGKESEGRGDERVERRGKEREEKRRNGSIKEREY